MISWAAALLLALLPCASAQETPVPEPSLIGSKVRSDRWSMRRSPRKVEILEGNVRYELEGRRLRADRAVYEHDAETVRASGAIRAEETLKDGVRVSARGDEAFHALKSGDGRLTAADRVAFELFSPRGAKSGDGSAGIVRWNVKRGTAVLEEEVHFSQPRGEAHAERASYSHLEGRIALDGRRPSAAVREPGWAAAVQADRITGLRLSGDRRRVIADGKVRGWLYFPEARDRAAGHGGF